MDLPPKFVLSCSPYKQSLKNPIRQVTSANYLQTVFIAKIMQIFFITYTINNSKIIHTKKRQHLFFMTSLTFLRKVRVKLE